MSSFVADTAAKTGKHKRSIERDVARAEALGDDIDRVAGRLLSVGDTWFQIERLLHFNAKFQPRWQPRYVLFGGAAQLPRVALGALWAEGQLPAPRLRTASGVEV